MKFVVAYPKVFIWTQDVICKLQAEVKQRDAQLGPPLLQQVRYALRRHEFEIIVHSLLNELPVQLLDRTSFEPN